MGDVLLTRRGGGTQSAYLRELSYIEGSGTQFVDTRVAPKLTTRLEIELTPLSAGLSENAVFGSSWATNGFFLGFYRNMIRFHSRGAYVDVSTFNATSKNIIVCTPNQIVVNGRSYSLSGTGTDSSYPIEIFSCEKLGYNGANGIFRLHKCKIYDNNVLLRDFIPVLDRNKSPCLWDKVNKQFFYNVGTGVFKYAT